MAASSAASAAMRCAVIAACSRPSWVSPCAALSRSYCPCLAQGCSETAAGRWQQHGRPDHDQVHRFAFAFIWCVARSRMTMIPICGASSGGLLWRAANCNAANAVTVVPGPRPRWPLQRRKDMRLTRLNHVGRESPGPCGALARRCRCRCCVCCCSAGQKTRGSRWRCARCSTADSS